MIPFLGLFLSVILIICGLIFKKSKFVYVVQFLWMWILTGFNHGGGDYGGYEFMYSLYSVPANIQSPEIFYKGLCYISNSLGLDLVAMEAITSFFVLLIIFIVVSKHTKSKCFAISLFMIFPFIDNIIQKRFFIGTAFIFIGFHFLLTGSNWKNRIIYIIFCVIAAQFHTSMYFFLIFMLADFDKIKIDRKFIFWALTISFLTISFVPGILSALFNSSKIYLYFYDESMRLDSPFKVGAYCLIHILFVFLINKSIGKSESSESIKIKRIMLISLVFLPFYIYNSVFFRIIRLCIILGYVGVAKRYDSADDRTNDKCAPLLVGYLVTNFLFFYCLSGSFGYEVLVRPMFDQNVVIQQVLGDE